MLALHKVRLSGLALDAKVKATVWTTSTGVFCFKIEPREKLGQKSLKFFPVHCRDVDALVLAFSGIVSIIAMKLW